jgi:exo-beta-1,3-glucanase (GH17 family)
MEDYILFKPNPGIHDDNTNITYTNMFVAMMDAVYSAIKAMGYDDLDIVVAESGWPSLGDPNQPMCTVENAVLYNKNMRILSLEQPQRGIGACLGQILARFMMLAF